MSGIRAALRISRRDAWRAKGRSALVLVMVGLPVLVITAVAVLAATLLVGPVEGLSRDLGTADARVHVIPGAGAVGAQDHSGKPLPPHTGPWTAERLAGLFPPGSRVVPLLSGARAYQGKWINPTQVREVDLRDPLTRGLYLLRQGRPPAAPAEVLVSPLLVRNGVGIGSTLTLSGESTPSRVVGVADDARQRGLDFVIALPGADASRRPSTDWLVDTPADVTRDDVRRLWAQGFEVSSRALISATGGSDPMGHRLPSQGDRDQLVVGGLVIVMIVLEVVLLAGPAFAVGIRRRRRELSLIAAQGASSRQLRWIVLADGFVLGGVAALLGLAGGLAAAAAAVPLLEGAMGVVAGPFEIPLGQVAAVAALGVASAVLAAVVPARQAARADVVRALAGLRGEPKVRRGWPLAGLVLLTLGSALTVAFNVRSGPWYEELAVGLSLTMVGMVMLTPWLVGVAGRLAGRLPLPFRLAARDATRNRGRTAPAVAAVMAATATFVMMLIITTSEDAWSKAGYRTDERQGAFTVSARNLGPDPANRLRAVVQRALPGTPLIDVYRPSYAGGHDSSVRLRPPVCLAEPASSDCRSADMRADIYDVRVGGPDLLRYLTGRDDPGAAAALAAGKAVVFRPGVVGEGKLVMEVHKSEGAPTDRQVRIPAVEARSALPGAAGVLLPMRVATDLGLKPLLRRLVVDPSRHQVTPQEEERTSRMIEDVAPGTVVHLERGYQSHVSELLILGVAAAVLILGGTFAATGLAAADARPDLSTLGAVGAAPWTLRLVTMGQAWFIAVTGVALGVVAGFVPGVSSALAAARNDYPPTSPAPGIGASLSAIVVPWTAIAGLIVLLPLVAGLVAATFGRAEITLSRRVT